ncbi:T9SS type A sorting domain-containing protein [Chryseobacterium arthrosphaerae]|uniref:T9SS type A sorting domain-containing protein n=1 Tax=Chryseobacterium arthrosphaerae TaxID=651561 RepID=UPI003B8A7C1B
MTLSPNPVTDLIKVTITDIIEKIDVYDAAGKKMHVRENTVMVEVSGFLSGGYLIKIQSGKRVITEKFIIR